MKNDALEKFIIDNREEFDDFEPKRMLSFTINKRPYKSVKISWAQIMGRVAAAIILFTSGFLVRDYITSFPDKMNNAVQLEQVDSVYREFFETKSYYISQIKSVKRDIYSIGESNNETQLDIRQEIKEIDTFFKNLDNDLNDQTNDEEVIKAIINNYRAKLKMLQDMKWQMQPTITRRKEVSSEAITS